MEILMHADGETSNPNFHQVFSHLRGVIAAWGWVMAHLLNPWHRWTLCCRSCLGRPVCWRSLPLQWHDIYVFSDICIRFHAGLHECDRTMITTMVIGRHVVIGDDGYTTPAESCDVLNALSCSDKKYLWEAINTFAELFGTESFKYKAGNVDIHTECLAFGSFS